MTQYYKIMKSPVGKLTLVADDENLIAILWENDKPKRVKTQSPILKPDHRILKQVEKQLTEYFKGERKTFDINVKFMGTDFQNKVWKALKCIPYGETWTYSQLAKKVGSPQASRAVGAANGRNPVSIIIPCHRVNGKDGKLTGFAGGLENKAFLQKLEGVES